MSISEFKIHNLKRKCRPIRILLMSPIPPPEGGIATWTKHILHSDQFKKLDLIHLNTAAPSHKHIGGSTIVRVGMKTLQLYKLIKILIKKRPSVVHITTGSGLNAFFGATIFIYLCKVGGANPILNLRFGNIERLKLPRIFEWLLLRALKVCTFVVPITKETDEYLRSIGCLNTKIIGNCVDIRHRNISNNRNNESNQLKVLFVGWVIPAKGVNDLFEAMSLTDCINATIIGPEMHASSIRKSSNSQFGVGGKKNWAKYRVERLMISERVNFMGRLSTSETRQAYLNADALVLPSYQEGFPNVVLEAMESGIPVLGTKVGAIPEIIEHKTNGLLIEPGDIKNLVKQLEWLRDNPEARMKMGKKARQKVIDNYSVDTISKEWVSLYSKSMS